MPLDDRPDDLVRWIAGDPSRVRAMLTAALGTSTAAGQPIVIPGLRLDVVDAGATDRSGAADRLEIASAGPSHGAPHWDAIGPEAIRPDADRPGAAPAGAGLLALGWATVDLERAARAWSGVRWADAARDSAVGARALAGWLAADRPGLPRAGGAGRAEPGIPVPPRPVVLLEPDTEGRLAAALARHGEGPAVLYVGLAAAGITAARAQLEEIGIDLVDGSGPLGTQVAAALSPAWGPTLVLVPGGRRR